MRPWRIAARIVYCMMPKLIDTHAHLYSAQLQPDIAEVVARAQAVCEAVFLPNIDMDSIGAMLRLTDMAPDFFFPMMGLHPCDVGEDWEQVLAQMHALLQADIHSGNPRYVGIGETGLDLHWDTTTLDRQRAALQVQIEWAKAYQLPIILHARKAIDETLDMIERNHDASLRGIFHCFDGTSAQAQRIVALGSFVMGIGGNVTYKSSPLPESLHSVPLDYLVLETDSPYLAPVPHRGKRNESSYIQLVAERLAEIYQCAPATIAETTTRTACTMFQRKSIPTNELSL